MTNELTLELLQKFIIKRNESPFKNNLQFSVDAIAVGFSHKLLGESTAHKEPDGAWFTWLTPFGLLKEDKDGKLSLLSKKEQHTLAAETVIKQIEPASEKPATAEPEVKQISVTEEKKLTMNNAKESPATTTAQQDVFESNGKIYVIPLDKIFIDKNLHARRDLGDINALAGSIQQSGQLRQIIVRPGKNDGEVYLVQGRRRLEAFKLLESQGVHYDGVEAIYEGEGTTEAERIMSSLIDNDGKPLTIPEQAEVYKRLADQGISTRKIADKTGYTLEHIRNCIKLAEAPKEVKEAVDSGNISATTAIHVIKSTKDTGKQKEIVAAATAKGAAKADKKDKGAKGKKAKVSQAQVLDNPESSKNVKLRLEEIQGSMVVTQTKAKFSEAHVWDICEYIRIGKGSLKKLVL